MEPMISTILQALASGASAAATGIANDEVKHIYNEIKTLIYQKWIGKPSAEKLLSQYEQNPKQFKELLTEKLEECHIHQDQQIFQLSEKLLMKINNLTVDQNLTATVEQNTTLLSKENTGNISIQGSQIKATIAGRDYVVKKQSLLVGSIALGLIVLIGLLTGKIQPAINNFVSTITNPFSNNLGKELTGKWKFIQAIDPPVNGNINGCANLNDLKYTIEFLNDGTLIASDGTVINYKVPQKNTLVFTSNSGSMSAKYEVSDNVLTLEDGVVFLPFGCIKKLSKM